MPWRNIWLAGMIVAGVGCGGALQGPQVASPPPDEPALKAFVIVVKDKGRTRGITITKEAELRQLERFFPNCRTAPSGRGHGSWETRYEVNIRFRDGTAVLLRSDGQLWTAGDGDLRVKGDVAAFLDRLLPTETGPDEHVALPGPEGDPEMFSNNP